jgi:ectoine hydroxylase
MTAMTNLDDSQLADFSRDGFCIARQMFGADEIDLLRDAALEDRTLDDQAVGRNDGEGGAVRLKVWNQPAAGVYGIFSRSRRLVDSMEKLLEGEVYHYHSKMILKDPRTGGAFVWHQDYGYWYDGACLYPLMASVAIAVDPATRANGCMQVLSGSHHMGRIDHVDIGEQRGGDPERVEMATQRLDLVYCELEPGDALFFHCNVLHRSDQNRSDDRRWSMVCCYNAARNDPYNDSKHSRYTPLEKDDDNAIREYGAELTQ